MWLKRLQEEVGSEVTNEKLKEFIWSTLKSGQVHTQHEGGTSTCTMYMHVDVGRSLLS